MLTAWLKGPTEINLWHGVADQAQAREVNLFCFSGGIPHWPVEHEAQKNILFDIAGKQNVDGLLIWANILSHTLDRSSLEAFCQRYAPLPTISMGMVLPAIPSIKIDMRAGMRRLLSHLIETHGRQKIAFIRGSEVSQDAEDRYQAYCETLSQYGLPLDPGLIVPGDFRRHSGKVAIQELIDQRRADFNAVVSANDNMAIGALQALQERGVRVPDDVVVTGFDDIEETQAVVPTLTTVRCPWHRLGRNSVDLMLSRLSGEPVAEQILLPTELVCRQSCGCQPLAFDDRPEHPQRPAKTYVVSGGAAGLSAPLTIGEHIAEIEAALLATASVQGLDAAWCRQACARLHRRCARERRSAQPIYPNTAGHPAPDCLPARSSSNGKTCCMPSGPGSVFFLARRQKSSGRTSCWRRATPPSAKWRTGTSSTSGWKRLTRPTG